jgi:hypothetical protein
MYICLLLLVETQTHANCTVFVTIIVAQSNYHATLRLYIVPTAVLDNGSILASLYYANSGTKKPWRSLLHVASNEPQASSTAITCAQQLLYQEQLQQRQLQQQQQQSAAPIGSVVSDTDDDRDFECIHTSAQHTSTVTDDIA